MAAYIWQIGRIGRLASDGSLSHLRFRTLFADQTERTMQQIFRAPVVAVSPYPRHRRPWTGQ